LDPDTQIGGHGRFPETRLSVLEALRSPAPEVRSCAWENIVRAYWKPVYKYVRLKWHADNESAKDLTQGFFTRAVEKDFFMRYNPSKAGFRTFLRTCCDGFVANERKAASRLKRVPLMPLVSLDFETAEGELARQTSAVFSTERFFHEEWVRHLFSLSVDSLRSECSLRNRDLVFRAFEMYDLAPVEARPTYDEIARLLNIPITQVTNYLAAARRDLRRIVLDTLREITATDREFRSEAHAILGVQVQP
jgi:RNA polymerase sigma factor (sigma-70 family)